MPRKVYRRIHPHNHWSLKLCAVLMGSEQAKETCKVRASVSFRVCAPRFLPSQTYILLDIKTFIYAYYTFWSNLAPCCHLQIVPQAPQLNFPPKFIGSFLLKPTRSPWCFLHVHGIRTVCYSMSTAAIPGEMHPKRKQTLSPSPQPSMVDSSSAGGGATRLLPIYAGILFGLMLNGFGSFTYGHCLSTPLLCLENTISLQVSTPSSSVIIPAPPPLWSLEPWGKRYDVDVSFKAIKISYSQYINQLWVSEVIIIYCKKQLLWWVLTNALIYGDKVLRGQFNIRIIWKNTGRMFISRGHDLQCHELLAQLSVLGMSYSLRSGP